MRTTLFFILFCTTFLFSQKQTVTLSGEVISTASFQPLSYSNIIVKETSAGGISDSSGVFQLNLRPGIYHLILSHIGFKTSETEIKLLPGINLQHFVFMLDSLQIEAGEIIVEAPRQKADLERYRLNRKDLNNIPNLYSDVMRSVQLIAGVSSNNEMSSSYNVHGGNFDENLVYLNGYEIYRPFLLRQGFEENQSTANPDMTEELKFFANGFPVSYGDKMSSVMEINYKKEFENRIDGSVSADLTRLSAMGGRKFGNLNINLAFRYAYPGIFLNTLRTAGSYLPSFFDIQTYFNYNLNASSLLEGFIFNSSNRFRFSPYEYSRSLIGVEFQPENKPKVFINGMKVKFNGEKNFIFNTRGGGLRFTSHPYQDIQFTADLFIYHTRETEISDVYSDFYITESVTMSGTGPYEYIKSDAEKVNNLFEMTSGQGRAILKIAADKHLLECGLQLKKIRLTNSLNEFYFSRSNGYTTENPFLRNINTTPEFTSAAFYLQDDFRASDEFRINAGVRYLRNEFTDENLWSPRGAVYFAPSDKHTFSFGIGYYYQPPFYYELRNKSRISDISLKSQKTVGYSIGWDYLFREKVKFQMQCFYKDLSNLIPCYIDQLNLEYGDKNNLEGYAYGADLQFQGEITKNMHSWISYSYLNTKERSAETGGKYLRRFLDQTHTVLVFLQDKIAKRPEFQVHLRMIFGSGFLYPGRKAVKNPDTENYYIMINLEDREQYPFYMRADMGMTYDMKFLNILSVRFIMEVMNVFDKANVSGYTWINTIKELKQPFWAQQLYSERFFNVGMTMNF